MLYLNALYAFPPEIHYFNATLCRTGDAGETLSVKLMSFLICDMYARQRFLICCLCPRPIIPPLPSVSSPLSPSIIPHLILLLKHIPQEEKNKKNSFFLLPSAFQFPPLVIPRNCLYVTLIICPRRPPSHGCDVSLGVLPPLVVLSHQPPPPGPASYCRGGVVAPFLRVFWDVTSGPDLSLQLGGGGEEAVDAPLTLPGGDKLWSTAQKNK